MDTSYLPSFARPRRYQSPSSTPAGPNSSSRSETTPPAQTQRLASTSHPQPAAGNQFPGSSYFTYPMAYAVSGILRRLSDDTYLSTSRSSPQASSADSLSSNIYSAPRRHASPFQPPPLTPLTLCGQKASTKEQAKILNTVLAEEIRLLVPPRLQLVETWQLIYSLEQDGVMLSTLYDKSEDYRGRRGGFVLAVRDSQGSVFGAYLSDAPKPSAHYYGTGECFLWRATILKQMLDLSSLPPPPSADTTNMQRSTTLYSPTKRTFGEEGADPTGTNTPERLRFKAFPYSGINDYMIYCQADYLSIGGGDGHYGLWLDDSLDKGVSDKCLTFGNEPLSEEGSKFAVMGVEMWYLGA